MMCPNQNKIVTGKDEKREHFMTFRLTISEIPHDFLAIKGYRAAHALPDSFSVAHFEPKDYAGLGRIDSAGLELNAVRTATLAQIEALTGRTPLAWLDAIPALQSDFERALIGINGLICLRPVEIEFAAAGFGDVCRAFAYALLRAQADGTAPTFARIYGEWLDSTVRVSQTVHRYVHNGAEWRVQIVTHAYGRAGMIIVREDGATDYVADATIGCPAEGYMAALLGEVTARMWG